MATRDMIVIADVRSPRTVLVSNSVPLDRLERVYAEQLIAEARQRAGLSLRELAARAQTSHSAIAAYEQGRTSPTVATLNRIVRAAGLEIDTSLTRRMTDPARGRELAEVLELAAMFPARHGATLSAPVFGRPA